MVPSTRRLLAMFLVAMPALASSPYPTEMKNVLTTPAVPACTVCHQDLLGGAGTVNRPFGVSARANGLTGGVNISSLRTALDRMADAGVDSDADGVGDIAELQAGTDPNGATGGLRYGCGAEVTPGLSAAALVLGLMLLRRRSER